MERTFDNNQTNIFVKYIWSHCGTTVRHACWLPCFPTKITIHQARVLRGARNTHPPTLHFIHRYGRLPVGLDVFSYYTGTGDCP